MENCLEVIRPPIVSPVLNQEKEYRHVSAVVPDKQIKQVKSTCNYIKSIPCGSVNFQKSNVQKVVKTQEKENITIEDDGN
jgi:hypothetical protein